MGLVYGAYTLTTSVTPLSTSGWEAMQEDLSSLHLPEGDVQMKWDFFETALKSSITTNVLSRTKKSSNKKPWLIQKIKTLINKRNRAHNKWRRMKPPQHFESYKHAKAKVQETNKERPQGIQRKYSES